MTTIRSIFCLIAVLLCANLQGVFTNASTRTEVSSKLVCVSEWQKLKLNWNFMVANISTNDSFDSFWREHEESFKEETIKRLQWTVIYPRNFTKTFSCYGTVASHKGSLTSWSRDVSFDVQLAKIGAQLLDVKFMTIFKYERQLEFYFKPGTNISCMTYSINYCWNGTGRFITNLERNYTCPRYETAKIRRSDYKSHGVSKIPNSDGFICKAITGNYIHPYTNYRFFIRSSAHDGSASESSNFHVETKQSTDKSVSSYADRGYFVVVLMGQKPAFLIAEALDKVTLRWQDTGAYLYRVKYRCSNGVNKNKTTRLTSISISNQTVFAPYTSCDMCVQGQTSAGGLFSEPTCNTTRFPENFPSKPPSITCNYTTCAMTEVDDTRNITVTCEFPEKNTRNGLLNKLVIHYWNDSSNDVTVEKLATTNLTSCQITLRGLSKRLNYFAQLRVCNSKGCSGVSDRASIAKAISSKINTSGDQEWQRTFTWVVITIVVVLIVIVPLTVFGIPQIRKKRQTKTQLPTVEEPNTYEHLDGSVGHKLNEYDQIPNTQDTNDNSVHS